MTEVTPRPMVTPDLAGLLAKPRRPSEPHEEPSVRPDPLLSELEMTHLAAEGLPQRALDDPRQAGDRAKSTGPGRKSSGSARNRGGRTANSAGAETPGRQYLRSMSIYLPRSLHQRLGERADADGSTRTALILTAINRTHDSIGSALNPARAGSGGDLFDIPQRTARKEPSVETTIRVTDRQLEAIDNLAVEHGANRSRLISVVLQAYLS